MSKYICVRTAVCCYAYIRYECVYLCCVPFSSRSTLHCPTSLLLMRTHSSFPNYVCFIFPFSTYWLCIRNHCPSLIIYASLSRSLYSRKFTCCWCWLQQCTRKPVAGFLYPNTMHIRARIFVTFRKKMMYRVHFGLCLWSLSPLAMLWPRRLKVRIGTTTTKFRNGTSALAFGKYTIPATNPK